MKEKDFISNIISYQKSLNTKMKIEEKSQNTIKAYNRTYNDFTVFCNYYHKELKFSNIKESDIYAFIEYKSETMNKQGSLSTSSVNSLISHLKKLFRHIEKNSDELYDFDKVFEDIKLKQPQRRPKGIGDRDFKKLLHYLESTKDDESFRSFRNITLFKFMFYGCMRASEAVSICLNDIELDSDQLFYRISFRQKGNRLRETYIKKSDLEDEVKAFVDIFEHDENIPIAITSNGGIMDRVQLSKMVNVVYRKAGLKKITGVHILRHTAAKRLLAAGVSITVVQSLLGHKSIQTTSIYTDPTVDIIKKELLK